MAFSFTKWNSRRNVKIFNCEMSDFNGELDSRLLYELEEEVNEFLNNSYDLNTKGVEDIFKLIDIQFNFWSHHIIGIVTYEQREFVSKELTGETTFQRKKTKEKVKEMLYDMKEEVKAGLKKM